VGGLYLPNDTEEEGGENVDENDAVEGDVEKVLDEVGFDPNPDDVEVEGGEKVGFPSVDEEGGERETNFWSEVDVDGVLAAVGFDPVLNDSEEGVEVEVEGFAGLNPNVYAVGEDVVLEEFPPNENVAGLNVTVGGEEGFANKFEVAKELIVASRSSIFFFKN